MEGLVKYARRLPAILITLTVSLIALVPVAWVYRTALMNRQLAFSMPPRIIFLPTLENFVVVLKRADFFASLLNSVIISSLATAFALLLGSYAAYALSRWRSRKAEIVSLGILATRMVPTFAVMLPYFLLLSNLGLLDTHAGLIISYLSFNLPFAVWILTGFINSIPHEMDECAMIDGANRLMIASKIVLPMAAPGIASTAILSFVFAWNEFLLALIISSRKAVTAPVMLLSFITPEGIEWGPVSAAAALIITPMILVYIFLRRHLVRGFAEGALKA
jgi:multiple sugar transport system permease protein